jgi:hypothetical protein
MRRVKSYGQSTNLTYRHASGFDPNDRLAVSFDRIMWIVTVIDEYK